MDYKRKLNIIQISFGNDIIQLYYRKVDNKKKNKSSSILQ